MIQVGIIGGTGYVGAELIRLLSNHNKVNISGISSVKYRGKPISSIYSGFYQTDDLECENQQDIIEKSDLIFLALPSGLSQAIVEKAVYENKICIDMGADFRFKNENLYKKWYGKTFLNKSLHEKSVYGLPELNRDEIRRTQIIGNPGCYATSVELALLPLLSENLIEEDGIIADCKSGITGSGKELTESNSFKKNVKLTFVPHLLPINRGILSTIYATPKKALSLEEVHEKYSQFYKNENFIKMLPLGEVSKISGVRLSNYCHISLHYDDDNNKLIVISCLDNMMKGSAGQGIQNMNIALGFSEKEGLTTLPAVF